MRARVFTKFFLLEITLYNTTPVRLPGCQASILKSVHLLLISIRTNIYTNMTMERVVLSVKYSSIKGLKESFQKWYAEVSRENNTYLEDVLCKMISSLKGCTYIMTRIQKSGHIVIEKFA
jgi:hypothetical protein